MAKKLTQGKVLRAMHLGSQIIMDNNGDKTVYRMSKGQQLVDRDLVGKLLMDGLIEGNQDCLPGIGQSQSYSIKRGLQ